MEGARGHASTFTRYRVENPQARCNTWRSAPFAGRSIISSMGSWA